MDTNPKLRTHLHFQNSSLHSSFPFCWVINTSAMVPLKIHGIISLLTTGWNIKRPKSWLLRKRWWGTVWKPTAFSSNQSSICFLLYHHPPPLPWIHPHFPPCTFPSWCSSLINLWILLLSLPPTVIYVVLFCVFSLNPITLLHLLFTPERLTFFKSCTIEFSSQTFPMFLLSLSIFHCLKKM